jgi:hypothetical protein
VARRYTTTTTIGTGDGDKPPAITSVSSCIRRQRRHAGQAARRDTTATMMATGNVGATTMTKATKMAQRRRR